MSRTRSFILLAGAFLLASSAWADDLGYVDCAAHPESTQVFAKPRQTPDSVATVACGERFTILLNGFIFSRVQTKDGKVGYIYSSVITMDHDRSGAAPAQSAAGRAPAAPAASVRPAVANAATRAPAYAQPTSASQAASMPVTTSLPAEKPAASKGPLFPTPPMPAVTAADVNYSSPAKAAPAASSAPTPAPSVQPAPAASAPAPVNSQAAAKPAAASAPVSATPSASASVTPPESAPASAPSAPAPTPSQPSSSPGPTTSAAEPQPSTSSTSAQSSTPAQPGPLFPTTPTPAPAPPASSTSDTAPAPAPAAAEPAPASQPLPGASQPAPEPLRSAKARASWEQPVAGVRQNFLLEVFAGYGFAGFNSGGVSTNLQGGMGSVGYNFKPWLQLGGDSSYNLVTINGVRNVLYGNHFGVRYFYHRFSRFTPFAEGLVGGSRVDTNGGGVKTSTNCISYKLGGGLDYRASRRWEIRIINVDYYRTSFGTGTGYPGQNNYWASAGVVMRLFGSGGSE